MNKLCYFCQSELQDVPTEYLIGNCERCSSAFKLKYVKSFYKNNQVRSCVITDLKISVHINLNDNLTSFYYYAGRHIANFDNFAITPANFKSKTQFILTFQ